MQFAFPEFSFIVFHALPNVSFAVFDQTVNDPGELVGGRGDRFGRPQSAFHPTIESAQRGLAPFQGDGGHAQGIGEPVDHPAGVAAQDLAPADAVVRAEP